MSTDAPLTATVGEHAAEAAGLLAHDAITQAAAQLAQEDAEAGGPRDRPLPGFEPPPCDAYDWGRRIESKNREIEGKLLAFEKSAKQTKTLKTSYEDANKELHALIRAMAESRRRAEGELVQPALAPVASEGAHSQSCLYERQVNEPCPLCIMLRKAGSPLPSPDDTEHRENVFEALAQAEAVSVGELAEHLEQHDDGAWPEDVVASWPDAQRIEASVWCYALDTLDRLEGDVNRPARPAFLSTDPAPVAEPTTAAEALEQTIAEHAVCLCQEPDFVVPADKDTNADARCTKCGGQPTGEGTHEIRFAPKPKPTKKTRKAKA